LDREKVEFGKRKIMCDYGMAFGHVIVLIPHVICRR